MWSKTSPTRRKPTIWVEVSVQTPWKVFHNFHRELTDMKFLVTLTPITKIKVQSKYSFSQ